MSFIPRYKPFRENPIGSVLRKIESEKIYRRAIIRYWKIFEKRQLERIKICKEEFINKEGEEFASAEQRLFEWLHYYKKEREVEEEKLKRLEEIQRSII